MGRYSISKCTCGGKLKAIYYPLTPKIESGYKCILYCDKSKIEVLGGGEFCNKKEARKLALEKLKKLENIGGDDAR